MESCCATADLEVPETRPRREDPAASGPPPPRILVAEDEEEMGLLLALHLEAVGYEVVRCRDGYELVERLGSYLLSSSTEPFDLVISDIRMPHVTGLDVLEGFADRDDFPPTILITAFGDEKTHERARSLGAADFFDKPFHFEDLVDSVRRLVPIRGWPRHVKLARSDGPDRRPDR